jgi:hypothetical protein
MASVRKVISVSVPFAASLGSDNQIVASEKTFSDAPS